MELEGRKELVDTGKSSRTWSVPTVSLRLAVLNVFQGFFAQKWLFVPPPPPTRGRNPPPRPPGGTPPPPDPRLDPPPNCPPPPLRVLKDSWGVGRIRTSCSHPPVIRRS